MNSTRNTRKSSEICGNGPKREPRSHQIPLVFPGDWTGLWRPARCQLVGRHFPFVVVGGGGGDGEPCLVGASVHGGEMARITAIIRLKQT